MSLADKDNFEVGVFMDRVCPFIAFKAINIKRIMPNIPPHHIKIPIKE
jgi:hypothetical protein